MELYDRPENRYVADFVGKSNFFDGTIERVNSSIMDVKLNCGIMIQANDETELGVFKSGDPICISVRPEQVIVGRKEDQLPADCAVKIRARVMNRIFLGEPTEYLLRDEQLGEFLVLSPRQNELNERPFETGELVLAAWSRDAALILKDALDE